MRIGTYYRYKLLKKLGIFSDIKSNSKVLDVGGFDGFILSKLKASKKILIDPNAKKEFSDVEYLKENLFSHDFKNEKFNFILSLDVLEHIPKEKESEYFSRIYSLLEKNGQAIITTPSKEIKIFPNVLRKVISKKWGHNKCLGYTKKELEDLLKTAKIKDYKIYAYNSRYYLNTYLLIRFLQIILPSILLKKILLKIANKDAKLNDDSNSRGYYLIKVKK